jgi:hypothetical protein
MASETTTGAIGRLKEYCTSQGLPLPPLEFDQDEPGELLMTGALLDFCRAEGISLNWLIAGHVQSAEERAFLKALAALSDHERLRLLGAVRAYAKGGMTMPAALETFGFKV